MYEPTLPRLAVVKSRISVESWAARVEAAQRDAKVLDEIAKRVDAGGSLNESIRQLVKRSRRSWVMRHFPAHRREGWEALIDERMPPEPWVAKACGPLIEAAREANARVGVDEVLEILKKQRVAVLPSGTTIKRHFRRVDDRHRYAAKKERAAKDVVGLPLAGGELLLAAEVETGAIAALTDEVVAVAGEAEHASEGRTPEQDLCHRNGHGQFTATYNRVRRRKRGEVIASYLRPACEKAAGKVPSWPRFVREQRGTLEAKLKTIVFSPLVSATQGWDALRAPEATGLGPLTGFAYMPSTLAKFTSALAQSEAGPRMLEAVGRNAQRVASARWGEMGAMAALYVDNHVKSVWSSLFTQSGKVSSLNRVMPCLTTTYVHTGAGAPVLVALQSGSAPLAPRLADLVRETEAELAGKVRRAVVIDAEGSTFDVLASFAKQRRVIVTPLRPSRMPELELRGSPGSYFRPYRDKDELRVAEAVLRHRSTGRTLEVGALQIRREHRERVLLTTGLALGMAGRDLADLYFARWPLQEAFFRDGAAVGLDEHRGNSGRMVANVAVITELEQLERRKSTAAAKVAELRPRGLGLFRALERCEGNRRRTEKALATRRRRLDALVSQGRTEGKQLGRAAVEHQERLARFESATAACDRAREALERHRRRLGAAQDELNNVRARIVKIEPMRTIRQLDVALDEVLTAAKLTCAGLITFALREYLAGLPMTPQTFATRIFGLRGRRETVPGEERIVFYENPRDSEITAALPDVCRRLNERGLKRDGRALRYAVEPAPENAAHPVRLR